MPDEYRADGWISFAGGMRLSDGARAAVGKDQAEVLVNVTVRHGRAEPRPAFRRARVFWTTRKAEAVFTRGTIQASRFYDGPDGGRWIFIADGHILSWNPANGIARMISPDRQRCFHRLARHAFLEQRGRWMIAQDGINPPVIIDGDNATVNEDPFNGVPTGMMMADGWHRLAVVAPDRKRIFISDHEFDPISTPLSFTDDATYFKNARYFQVPASLGPIVGITFAPSFNNQDDWGPLLVFCEHGTRAYQLQVPREQWADIDIAATVLPTVGACAHGAFAVRGNDVVFSDQNGRIQTFKQAITTRDDVRLRPADQAVWPLYRGEDAKFRRWRKAARFDDRILTTVWPEPVRLGNGRQAVRHRGLVVMEEDHLSDRPFVWAGLWTGIYPVAIESGYVSGGPDESPVEKCFAVSLDPDGQNRIYEITKMAGPDMMPEPRRVPMWLIPRWQDFEKPFARKKIQAAALQLAEIRGRVTITGYWQTSATRPAPWFEHHDAGAECLMFGGGDNCDMAFPEITGRPRVNLPAPASEGDFLRARPWLRVAGNVAIEEGIFEAGLNAAKPQANVSCAEPSTVTARVASCEPNYWEPHSSELPIDQSLSVNVCNG